MKLHDPAGSPQLVTILVVEQYGTRHVGWLDQQIVTLGLPQEPAVRYVQDAASLVGTEVKEDKWDTWKRAAPLEVVAARYDELLDLMACFRQERQDAAEASAR